MFVLKISKVHNFHLKHIWNILIFSINILWSLLQKCFWREANYDRISDSNKRIQWIFIDNWEQCQPWDQWCPDVCRFESIRLNVTIESNSWISCLSLRFVGSVAQRRTLSNSYWCLSVMLELCYAVIGSNILVMMDELQRLFEKLAKSETRVQKLFNTFAKLVATVILADVLRCHWSVHKSPYKLCALNVFGCTLSASLTLCRFRSLHHIPALLLNECHPNCPNAREEERVSRCLTL